MLTKDHDSYDPYQVFEVLHTPCLILTVTVVRGRNITMGFQDLYDTPDPFLKLVMKSSPEGKKWTTVKTDQTNPVWNETFTFYINFQQANVLEISLMEYNSLWFNQLAGTVYFDVVNVNEIGRRQLETFVFNGVSQVDIEFLLEFDRNPTLRYSLCLSTQEKAFMEKRKEKVFPAIRKFLGEEDGPTCKVEVPTIAVIGSGGGFRAMTAYSGVFKALSESGILDCSTYVCGLSGSSWFLSSLYSHPDWPNLNMMDFLEEIKHKMDKKLSRFLNASTLYTFYKIMAEKRKERQPVSFTDIFGRMVGETLISDRMESTLTDQRDKIKDGAAPMPLYTCVHVKKDVPARSFQEWVEFSPFEIGMPKYGTFMDSELFGSKFFMGKLVKQYKEQPLHFLQGIWGSAFCILFKRLFDDNRRIDPAEMLREQLQEQLVEEGKDSSSDCSDDDEVDGDSSVDDEDDDDENSDESGRSNGGSSGPEWSSMDSDVSSVKFCGSDGKGDNSGKGDNPEVTGENSNNTGRKKGKMSKLSGKKSNSQDLGSDEDSNIDLLDGSEKADADSAYEGEDDEDEEEEEEEDEESMEFGGVVKPGILKNVRKGSLEARLAQKQLKQLQESAGEGTMTDSVDGLMLSKPSSSRGLLARAEADPSVNLDQSGGLKKSVNWGECPKRHGEENEVAELRRKAYKRASSSMRKSRSGSKSYWKNFVKGLVESNSWEYLSTRQGRAAVIHNFMRGLNLQQTYPISPFTPIDQRVKEGDEFEGIFEMHSTSVKHIYMVDAGLTFNSPYPLVLRPQRQVDIILSFDFSARASDAHQPFKELLLAEKWAKLNRLPFPPIDASVFEREGMKELYIFRHPNDPHCPIVLHFTLVNKTFRHYSAPGVPRQTREEWDFADFDIFDDPKAPYSTFNFTYTHRNFERLSKLTEFNTLLHIEDIRRVMKEVVNKKRVGPPRVPIQSKDIKLLRMKSVQEMRRLKKFITRMESRSSIFSASSGPGNTPLSARGSISPSFFSSKSSAQDDACLNSSQESSVFGSGSPYDKVPPSSLFSSFNKSHRSNSIDILGSSLPSHTIHRMKQQQQQEQAESSAQQRRISTEFRPSLTSDTSIYGTPPDEMSEFLEPGRQRGEEDLASSPCPVFGTPPTVTDSTLRKTRSLVSIQEDSVDSVDSVSQYGDVTSPDHHPEPAHTVRKKPRVISFSPSPLNLDNNKVAPGFPSPSTTPPLNSMTIPTTKTRSPSPSPKLKMPEQFAFGDQPKPAVVSSTRLSDGNSSSSSGIWSMTPSSGLASSGGTGSATSGSSASSFTPDLLKKRKTRKESPPNPFFVNAHFMRSTVNSSTSSAGSLCLPQEPGDNKPVFQRGKSYRLSPQPLQAGSSASPFVTGFQSKEENSLPNGNNHSVKDHQAESSNSVLRAQTPTNEEFSMAPAAFRADGTPVTDQNLAKMFYNSAKDKRKLFRRQSTVSSLGSISLDDKDTSRLDASTDLRSYQSIPEENSEAQNEEGGDTEEKYTHFRDLFLSLESEGSVESAANNKAISLSSAEKREEFLSVSSGGSHSSGRFYSTNERGNDTTFDPELMDLSGFEGENEVESKNSEEIEAVPISSLLGTVPSAPSMQQQVSREKTDVWFDAKSCLS